MSLILEFGGRSMEPAFIAFRRVAEDQSFKILLLTSAEEHELRFREFCGSLEKALVKLAEGCASSIQLEGFGESPFLAGLYRPCFGGQILRDWSASAEGGNLRIGIVFEELQSIDGLEYIAIFKDESPEFDSYHITEKTFPWSDWRLVAGAVRRNKEWIVRGSAS